MDKKGLNEKLTKINYDEVADVLYVSFGEARAGLALEVRQGDFVRVDPNTDDIVGITILDFRQRYMASGSDDLDESAKTILPDIIAHLHAT